MTRGVTDVSSTPAFRLLSVRWKDALSMIITDMDSEPAGLTKSTPAAMISFSCLAQSDPLINN